MAPPAIVVSLYRADVSAWADVSVCVDLDAPPQITEAIEAPMETNEFVAPDVQVRLNVGDPAKGEFQFSWFDSIQPWSTDYKIKITVDGAQLFYGFVLPNTIQFNDAERWCAFTAIGLGAKLARWSAEDSVLMRTVAPWYIKSSNGNGYRATLVIERATPQTTCEFLTDDVIAVETGGGNLDEVRVVGVTADGTFGPFASFSVVVEGMAQTFPVGAAVTLVTRFVRNVALQTMVDALFVAAGLEAPVGNNFSVTPITGAVAQFASKPNLAGLAGLPLAATVTIAPDAYELPVIGTSEGTFVQSNPPLGPWHADPAYLQGIASRPVDWTDSSAIFSTMNFLMYGPRDESYPFVPTDPDSDIVYVRWRYWIRSVSAQLPHLRFGIAVHVGNASGTGTDYPFSVYLYRSDSYDGVSWSVTNLAPIGSGSTPTNLHEELWETVDIYVTGTTPGRARLVYTFPKSGDPVEYAVGHASVVDLSGHAEMAGAKRGRFAHGALFQSDTRRGNSPAAYALRLNELGIPTGWEAPVTIPRGFAPDTYTRNLGDNFWYALAANDDTGVVLLSYSGDGLEERVGWVPPQIEPPGVSAYVTLDLMAVRAGTTSGPWPMMAIVGTNVWWIAYAFTGVIPYADVEGLSCAEALAQLAVIVDAFFYVDAEGLTYFRSRASAPANNVTTGTSATSTRLDDATCLTLKRTSVWFKALRHVSVTNPRDESITGEAGDANFRDTEQGAIIESRFVTSVSFARAVAENTLTYLGRRLTTVDIEREADARRCEIGRSFTALIGGAVKSLQILQVTKNPVSGTETVQAVEM